MPDGRETGRIGDRYQLDYYRHSRLGRSWKWPATVAAVVLTLVVAGAVYGLRGKAAFQAAPVAGVHAAFGNNCRKCHDAAWRPVLRLATSQSAFRSVSNASCLACHVETAGHHAVGAGAEAEFACASCHSEHRPERSLQSVGDEFCLSCHRDLAGLDGTTRTFANAISGFGRGRHSHPEFALLRQDADAPGTRHGIWSVAARTNDSQSASWRDAGGLKFNHAAHLPTDGVLGPDRQPVKLQCSDCHRPEADGARMGPVNYEQHCRRCHPLQLSGPLARFNPIPHEAPDLLRGLLRERLAEELANGSTPEKTSAAGVPGDAAREDLLPVPVLVTPGGNEYVGAELAKIDHAIFGLEAQGFCRKCHHVQADNRQWRVLPNDPGVELAQWQTGPLPIVPQRWFFHARFDHESHRTWACTHCHQAERSSRTSDVILPSISVCRECHGAGAAAMAGKVGDRCTQCHDYHTDIKRFHQ